MGGATRSRGLDPGRGRAYRAQSRSGPLSRPLRLAADGGALSATPLRGRGLGAVARGHPPVHRIAGRREGDGLRGVSDTADPRRIAVHGSAVARAAASARSTPGGAVRKLRRRAGARDPARSSRRALWHLARHVHAPLSDRDEHQLGPMVPPRPALRRSDTLGGRTLGARRRARQRLPEPQRLRRRLPSHIGPGPTRLVRRTEQKRPAQALKRCLSMHSIPRSECEAGTLLEVSPRSRKATADAAF